MNEYIRVTEDSEDDVIEIPIEVDGVILLSTLSAQYPGVTGLKYKNNNTGAWRGIRLENGKLWPPESNNWGNNLYYAVFPKDNKKRYESGGSWYNNNNNNINTCSADACSPSSGGFGNGSSNKYHLTAGMLMGGSEEGQPKKCCDLIILGLPWSADECRLKDFFSKFGELVFAQIKRDASGKSKGFGFIRFAEYEAQINCLSQKHNIDGRICEVRVPHSKTGSVTLANAKIHVGRVTDDISTEDIHSYFSHYGKVVEVFVPKPCRGFAFVTFQDSEVAQRLIGEDLIIKNTSVRISPANAQPWEGRAGPGGGHVLNNNNLFQQGAAGGFYIGNPPPTQQLSHHQQGGPPSHHPLHHHPNGLGCPNTHPHNNNGSSANAAMMMMSSTPGPLPSAITNKYPHHHPHPQYPLTSPHGTGPYHFQYAAHQQHANVAAAAAAAFGLAYAPPLPPPPPHHPQHPSMGGSPPNSNAPSYYNHHPGSAHASPADGGASSLPSHHNLPSTPSKYAPLSPMFHAAQQQHQQQLSPLSHQFARSVSPSASQQGHSSYHRHHPLQNNGGGGGDAHSHFGLGPTSNLITAAAYYGLPPLPMGQGGAGNEAAKVYYQHHHVGANECDGLSPSPHQAFPGLIGPGPGAGGGGGASLQTNFGNGGSCVGGGVAAAANMLAAQNFIGALMAAQHQQQQQQHQVAAAAAAAVAHQHQFNQGADPFPPYHHHPVSTLGAGGGGVNEDAPAIHSDLGSPNRRRNDSALSSLDDTANCNSNEFEGAGEAQQQQQQFLFNMLAAAGGNSMAAAANLILLNTKMQHQQSPPGSTRTPGSTRYNSFNGSALVGNDLPEEMVGGGGAVADQDDTNSVIEQIYAAAARSSNSNLHASAPSALLGAGEGPDATVVDDNRFGSPHLAPIPSSAWNDVPQHQQSPDQTSLGGPLGPSSDIEDAYYDLALTAAAAAISSSPTPLTPKQDHYATNNIGGTALHDSSSNLYTHHFAAPGSSKLSTPRLHLGPLTTNQYDETEPFPPGSLGVTTSLKDKQDGAQTTTTLDLSSLRLGGGIHELLTNAEIKDSQSNNSTTALLYSRVVRSPLTSSSSPNDVVTSRRQPSESFSGSINKIPGADNRCPW